MIGSPYQLSPLGGTNGSLAEYTIAVHDISLSTPKRHLRHFLFKTNKKMSSTLAKAATGEQTAVATSGVSVGIYTHTHTHNIIKSVNILDATFPAVLICQLDSKMQIIALMWKYEI